MAFTGLSTHDHFIAGPLNGEDVSDLIAMLAEDETPTLDFFGTADTFARNTVHEYLEERLRPNVLVTSSAINSASAGATVLDHGDLMTVGTVLEYQTTGAQVQITTIAGATSIGFSQAFGGSPTIPNSVAVGAELHVVAALSLEGEDHPGNDISRLRDRKTNYVSKFQYPLAISGTQEALAGQELGNITSEFDRQTVNRAREAVRDLERMLLAGRPSGNSIGSATAYRSTGGLRYSVSSINSTVTATSFAADPHLYIGNVMERAFLNGAMTSEDWGVIAGRTYFRNLSNLNDTKVQDSNQSEQFKRVIRTYEGPFGRMQLMLSRWMPATSLIIAPRARVKVLPLQRRNFGVTEMGRTGDNHKRLLIGEYTFEVHFPEAMAQLRS